MQDRINKLNPYFKEMQVNAANGIIYITIQFPKGWGCSELTEHDFNVKTAQDKDTGLFYFFTEINCGFDKIFDAIEYNIKFNEEAQIKVDLLRDKIDELTLIFEKEDIDTLKTLEFKYKKKTKGHKVKKNKIVKDTTPVSHEETLIPVEIDADDLTAALNTLKQQTENIATDNETN